MSARASRACSDAYDPELRAGLHRAADALGTPLHDGVYLAVSGPSFETPAEIRAFRTLGADLVGHVDRARGDRRAATAACASPPCPW